MTATTEPHVALAQALLDDPRRLPCMDGEPLSDDPDARRHVAEQLCPGCHVLNLCRTSGAAETWGVWGGIDRCPAKPQPLKRAAA